MFKETNIRYVPTHRCIECGAFWRFWNKRDTGQKKDSWSLRSRKCGQCCDTAPMGDQIVPIVNKDLFKWLIQDYSSTVVCFFRHFFK